MTAMDKDTESAVRGFLSRVAETNDLAGAILFGSRARGTHRPDSDADVAVLLRGEHSPFLQTKLAMADIAFDVLLDTGINISPFPVWMDEWEHSETYSNPALLANIAREGVRL
jgi:predicted nucleotidyltransferase